MNQTDWGPGLMMLAAGVIAALVYLFSSKKLQSEATSNGTVDDLEARYQRRLAELKEHHANKHLVPAATWEAEKTRLEAAAAAALRERDGVKHEAAKATARVEKKAAAQAQATGVFAKNPGLMGALISGAVVGFFVLLGVQLSKSTSEKQEGMGMPGGPGPMQQQPQQPQEDPRLEQLASRVQAAPDDVDAVADFALYLVKRQAFSDAQPLIARAAQLDPFHVKGRVARAVMRAVNNDVKGSLDELEHLADYYPEAYEARMYAGMIALDENDAPRALAQLELYVATAPASEQPPMMRMAVQQLREQVKSGQPLPPR